MKIAAALVLSWVWTAVSAASAADPLHTPECLKAQQALAALEDKGKEPASTPAPDSTSVPTIPPRLRALRQDVARRCLASSLDAPRPQRQVQQPLSVSPVVPSHSPSPTAAPAQGANPGANPAAVAQPPLRSITGCDAAGCWASDGTRLQRMGPNLVGPQGVCQVNGGVVSCP